MTYDLNAFGWQYVGQQVVVAVGQLPFEANSREFATLIPVTDINVKPFASREEVFPTHGDVFWMVTPQNKSYAEPGRLLIATLEEAREHDRTDKARYQAMVDSLDSVREDSLVEILTIPSTSVSKPREIIEPGFTLTIEHPPCAIVYARLGDHLYGPLLASSKPDQVGRHKVSLSAARDNRMVYRIALSELRDLPVSTEITVSRDARPVYQNGDPIICKYTLLPTRALSDLNSRTVFETWKTPGEIVREVTKRLFEKRLIFKKDRQTFVRAFEEIESVLMTSPEEFLDSGEKDIFDLIRKNIDHIEREAMELAQAIVDSELIDDKISAAIQVRVEQYIESTSATVKARIEEKVADGRVALEELEARKSLLDQELDVERQRRFEEIDVEIERRKEQLREREIQIERSRASLEAERKVLTETLEDVALKLNQGKDDTIRKFLELAPLLSEMGFFSNRVAVETSSIEEKPGTAPEKVTKLVLSPFASKGVSEEREHVSELEFFDRFSDHVSEPTPIFRQVPGQNKMF